MSYVSTPQPMGVQGRESLSPLYPPKVRRWRPMTFLDHERSSFVPQCHAGRAKSKIMQITCKKGGEIGAREEKG